MSTNNDDDELLSELYNELEKDTPDFTIVQQILSSSAISNSNKEELIGTTKIGTGGKTVLHHACSKNAPLSIIQEIINCNPLSVRQTDDHYGWYPLHYACWTKQSPLMIQLLVEAYPNIDEQKAHFGRHPLHLACIFTHSESLAVIQILINGCFIAIQQDDDDGDYPLHLACKHNAPLEVIQFLIQQWPDAIAIENRTGSVPLQCAQQQPNDNRTITTIHWLEEKTNAVAQLKTEFRKDNPDFTIIQQLLTSNKELIPIKIRDNGETILHLACSKNAPLTIIQDIIQYMPSLIKQRNDEYGWYPLHHACWKNQSLAVIQYLVDEYPTACQEQCLYSSRFPLHFACLWSQPELMVIKLLVKTYPMSVQHKDDYGDYPLHLACQSNSSRSSSSLSLDIIQFLVQQWPDGLTIKNDTGCIPLHCAQQPYTNYTIPNDTTITRWLETETKNRLVPEIQKDSPDFIAVENIVLLDRTVLNKPIDITSGRYLLHYACWKKAPLAIVQHFINSYPTTVTQQDVQGWYPLHYACRYNQSDLVIEELINRCPIVVTAKTTVDGNYPFHLACASCNQVESVIKLLLQKYPTAIQERNNHGYYPLHLACTTDSQSESVLKLLIQEFPMAIQERNHDGYYPLHLACATNNQHESVIKLLIQEYPEAVQERNYNGYYPLHLACATKASLDVLYLLVRQWPTFLSEQSIVSCTDTDEYNDCMQQYFPPIKMMKLS